MDQELKQRLIGAAVITALAAIFVPMLFDDPVDETGKSINELKIPELPAKAQDVEIMPLPEKVEDVAAVEELEKPLKTAPAPVEEAGVGEEADVEAPRPRTRLSGKETAVKETASAKQPHVLAPDEDALHADADAPIAEAEDVPPLVKPAKQPAPPVQSLPVVTAAPKVLKPAVKAPETAPAPIPADNPAKPATAANEAGTRWYLNAGSFSQKANAVALQDTLKQQGFAASVKEVAGPKGTVFKVRIGPMLDKAKAQAVKNKLTQINVNSFVSPDE
ncbi:MAG: SPOR domain-containing protein [Methylococcaceae bacterium]|nr:SPOR domain-containing protein [Methylococcaceae bacterium]